MDRKGIMDPEDKYYVITHYIYLESKIVKLIEAKNKMVVSRGWGERERDKAWL